MDKSKKKVDDQDSNHNEASKLKEAQDAADELDDVDEAPKTCCSDVRLFTLNLSLIIIFTLSAGVYTIGVIRTIERRFGLSSKQTGLIASMNDVSHILVVVFIGYIGRKAHKPKILSVSVVLCAITGFMIASTNFLFPATRPDTQYTSENSNSSQVEIKGRLCTPSYTNGNEDVCDGDSSSMGSAASNYQAYIVFIFAQLLGGVGGAGLSTLGLAYIDENSPKNKSSVYIGRVQQPQPTVVNLIPIFVRHSLFK